MEPISIIIFIVIIVGIYLYYGRGSNKGQSSRSSKGNQGEKLYPCRSRAQNSTIFRMFVSGGIESVSLKKTCACIKRTTGSSCLLFMVPLNIVCNSGITQPLLFMIPLNILCNSGITHSITLCDPFKHPL